MSVAWDMADTGGGGGLDVTELLRKAVTIIESAPHSGTTMTDPKAYVDAIDLLTPFAANDTQVLNQTLKYINDYNALIGKMEEQKNNVESIKADISNDLRQIYKGHYTDTGTLVTLLGLKYTEFIQDLNFRIDEKNKQFDTDGATQLTAIRQQILKKAENNARLDVGIQNGTTNPDAYGLYMQRDPNSGKIIDMELTPVGEQDERFKGYEMSDVTNDFGVPVYGEKVGDEVFAGNLALPQGLNSTKWWDIASDVTPGSVMKGVNGQLYYRSPKDNQVYKVADQQVLQGFLGLDTPLSRFPKNIIPLTTDQEQSLGSFLDPKTGKERIIDNQLLTGISKPKGNTGPSQFTRDLFKFIDFPSIEQNIQGTISTAPKNGFQPLSAQDLRTVPRKTPGVKTPSQVGAATTADTMNQQGSPIWRGTNP